MLLPLFDLTQAIKQVNQDENTSYPLNTDFGFAFFSVESLTNINNTLDYINQGIDADFFSEQEKNYLKARKQCLATAKAYCQNKSTEKPITAIIDEVLEKQLKSKEKYLVWQNYYYQQLIHTENWQPYSQVTPVNALRTEWEAQQAVARHTHAAILEASELLPYLMRHCRKAYKALKRDRYRLNLPAPVVKAYSDYLEKLRKSVLNGHQQLMASMLSRLQAYDQQQPHHMMHIMNKLQQVGTDKFCPDFQPSSYQDSLTHQQFNAYHAYILRYGDETLKSKLFECSWFKSSTTFPCVKKYTSAKQLQLIPEKFKKDIPRKRRRPDWLFKGANIRHEFFKQKTALLAHLQKAPDVACFKFDVEKPIQCQSLLTDIHAQEQLIQNALQELAEDKYQTLSPWFQRRTKKFLAKWKEQLKQHHEQQIANKILLAEKWVQALLPRELKPMQAAIYNWQSCQQLSSLLQEINEDCKNYQVNTALSVSLATVQKQAEQLLILNRIFRNFQHLASNQDIAESEWSYFSGYMQLLQIQDNQQYQAFLSLTLQQRTQIYANLKQLLKTFFDDSNQIFSGDKILLFYLAIANWGEAADQAKLKDQIQKFFLRYLTYLLKSLSSKPSEQQEKVLASAESILLTVGQSHHYAGDTLANYICDINSVKNNASLLKCKCLSLAMPLAEKYLQARWEKDIAQFDENIQSFILSNKTLNYKQSHVQILMGIRDRAVREHKLLEELDDLKPSEQVLIGLSNRETALIKPLVEASIQAHRTSQQIKSKTLPLIKKIKSLKQLSQQLELTLTKTSSPTTLKALLQSRSNTRLLFTKPYIESSLLVSNSADFPISRLSHS